MTLGRYEQGTGALHVACSVCIDRIGRQCFHDNYIVLGFVLYVEQLHAKFLHSIYLGPATTRRHIYCTDHALRVPRRSRIGALLLLLLHLSQLHQAGTLTLTD